MAPIPSNGTIAITGAAGFIGGWCVKMAVEKGFTVKACVRNKDDPNRVAFMKKMDAYASGRLTIHSADLDNVGCFDSIFHGCNGVLHVSHVSKYEDFDYVKKTCDHIINSINKAKTITRVIVTSSIAAVISEEDLQELVKRPVLYEDRYPDETNPRRNAKRQGYSMAKNIAMNAFSEAAGESQGQWDAITICPADNVGPILSKHQKDMGPWQAHIKNMLKGKYDQNGVYRPWMTVDVRDDAICHVELLSSVAVKNGERYIAWSTDTVNVEYICKRIDYVCPQLGHKYTEPREVHPEKLQKREAEFRRIWAGCELRNDRIRSIIPITFRKFDDSLRDCVESMINVAGIQPIQREHFVSVAKL